MGTTRIARTTRMPREERGAQAPLPAPRTRLPLRPSGPRPPSAWLICSGLPRIPLGAKPVITIGRKSEADVVLPHHSVSQHHAVLKVRGRLVQIEDEGSSNGTTLNGRRIQTGVVKPGVKIGIGPYDLEVEVEPKAAPSKAKAAKTETNKPGSRPLERPPPPEARDRTPSRPVRRPPPPPTTPRPPARRPPPRPAPEPALPQTVMEGMIEPGSITEVLQRIESERWSGQLVVTAADEVAGEVCVVDGKPLRATFDDLEGEDAVLGLLALSDGFYSFALAPLEGTPWRTTLSQLVREAELQREWLEGYSGVSDATFVDQLEYSEELAMGSVEEAPPEVWRDPPADSEPEKPEPLEPKPAEEDSGYQTAWQVPSPGTGPIHRTRPVYEEEDEAAETDDAADVAAVADPLGGAPGSEAYRRADTLAKTGGSETYIRTPPPGSEAYLREEIAASDAAPYDGGDDFPTEDDDAGGFSWDPPNAISDAAIAAIADADGPEATEAAILAATREMESSDAVEDDLGHDTREPEQAWTGIDSDSVELISASLRAESLRAMGLDPDAEPEPEPEPAAATTPSATKATAPAPEPASAPASRGGGGFLALLALLLGVAGGAAAGTWFVAERGWPPWLPWKPAATASVTPAPAPQPSLADLEAKLTAALAKANTDDDRRAALALAADRARAGGGPLPEAQVARLIDVLQDSEDPQAVFGSAPPALAREPEAARRKVVTAMFRAVERKKPGEANRMPAFLLAVHLLRVDAQGRAPLPDILKGLEDDATRGRMFLARALAYEQLNRLESAAKDLKRARKYAEPSKHARIDAHLERVSARR